VAVVVFHNLKTIFKVERVFGVHVFLNLGGVKYTSGSRSKGSSKLGDQSKSYNFGAKTEFSGFRWFFREFSIYGVFSNFCLFVFLFVFSQNPVEIGQNGYFLQN